MTHTNICLKNFVDTIYYFFKKTDDVTIIISGIISVIPKGKAHDHLLFQFVFYFHSKVLCIFLILLYFFLQKQGLNI